MPQIKGAGQQEVAVVSIDVLRDVPRQEKPLVYACSGCSNVAQLANDIAVVMDREGIARMSCIAGVAGDVKPLVKIACSGRPILAIDGCHLGCVAKCLARHQVQPEWHLAVTSLGIRKCQGKGYTPSEQHRAMLHIYRLLGVVADAQNPENRNENC